MTVFPQLLFLQDTIESRTFPEQTAKSADLQLTNRRSLENAGAGNAGTEIYGLLSDHAEA